MAATPQMGAPCRSRLTLSTTRTVQSATGCRPRTWSPGSPRSRPRSSGSRASSRSSTPPRTGGIPAPGTAPRSVLTRCGWPGMCAAAPRCRLAGLTGRSGSTPAEAASRALREASTSATSSRPRCACSILATSRMRPGPPSSCRLRRSTPRTGSRRNSLRRACHPACRSPAAGSSPAPSHRRQRARIR